MTQNEMVSRRRMNLHPTDSPPWRLTLFGRFSLMSPAGEPVCLPDRKTEALLAILALNRDLGTSRQAAANILWPGREPANLANLRQGLTVLRRALGSGAIESSAAHCRLASGFNLVTDYELPSLRESGSFMPGHDGDWFEDIRMESIEPALDEAATVVDHYFQSLQWFASYDPRSMYAILNATPAMARSLPFRKFARLLDTTKDSNPPRGWYAFWLGTVKSDLTECVELLRFALREARKSNDLVLASEVCLELGRAYSRTSELDRAMKICHLANEIGRSIANQRGSPERFAAAGDGSVPMARSGGWRRCPAQPRGRSRFSSGVGVGQEPARLLRGVDGLVRPSRSRS